MHTKAVKAHLLPCCRAETELLPPQERREHPDKCLHFGRVTKLSWERGSSSLWSWEVGSRIRKLLSSSGSPGLALGHRAPLLTACRCCNASRLAAEARWLLHGSYETQSVQRPESSTEVVAQLTPISIISTAPYPMSQFHRERGLAWLAP